MKHQILVVTGKTIKGKFLNRVWPVKEGLPPPGSRGQPPPAPP